MHIAVFLQDAIPAGSFFQTDEIAIFEKDEGIWTVTESIPVPAPLPGDIHALRSEIRQMVSRISEDPACRAVAGGEFSGIPFSEFDRAGFAIFSISSISDTVLDGIVDDIKQAAVLRNKKEGIIRNTKPVETDVPGIWYLDLAELQTQCPEVTSKKAMLDFVKTVPFLELHLVCKHVPPWMERMGLEIDSEARDGNVYAVIRKRECGDFSFPQQSC